MKQQWSKMRTMKQNTILQPPCSQTLNNVEYGRLRGQHLTGFYKGSGVLSASNLSGKTEASRYFKERIYYRELEVCRNREVAVFIQEIITGKKIETTPNNDSCLPIGSGRLTGGLASTTIYISYPLITALPLASKSYTNDSCQWTLNQPPASQ